MKNKLNLSKCLLLALLILPLQGCVGYRLGTMLPDDIGTVYIPNFKNDTDEPFLETETTRALVREIQQDGSLTITDQYGADSVLEVTLTKFELTPLVYERRDRARPNQYRVTLTARVRFLRASNQEVIAQNPIVRGDTTFDFSGDLTTAKRNALPDAAEDLARDIVQMIVETWK